MAVVQGAASWDVTPVSKRWVKSPVTGEILSGHKGEWFSVACAAYCAVRAPLPELATDLAGDILREVLREEQIFTDFVRARDGIGVLTAATIIAHNLGDLDRVLDIWNLPATDPLRDGVYKRGHGSSGTSVLELAGRLNKEFMAVENHRHFALREPRCLRLHQDLLLPTAPFFDAWGAKVARHPGLSAEEKAGVAAALIEGWDRLKGVPQGYARALAGLESAFPGGPAAFQRLLPARWGRILKAGKLRAQVAVSSGAFEAGFAKRALNAVK